MPTDDDHDTQEDFDARRQDAEAPMPDATPTPHPDRDFEAELRAIACGDSSCRIVRSRGMATNGGCRCFGGRSLFAAFRDPEVAHVVAKALHLRREQAADIERRLAEAREELKSRPMLRKMAPVQGFTPGIPWDMHLRAYDAYRKKWGAQQALIEGGCRGGFGTKELDEFIPGWREELSERKHLQDRAAAAESKLRWHEEYWRPPGDENNPVAIGVIWEQLKIAEAERDALAAKVARVEALSEKWALRGKTAPAIAFHAQQLRGTLAGDAAPG